MAKVLGLGGVFFKSADVPALRAWYQQVLGLEISDWGVFFTPAMVADIPGAGTVFGPFAATTDYFAPSTHDYMLNLLVDDLDAILAQAAAAGVEPIKRQDAEYGRFAHILDPEGRKLELWQPKA